ncbi:protein RAE1 [Citrus sinensis]|uniref:Protein RAE1 n=1 Tax=Citrus sinensis TaxID=2711 RepID=A0ACB8JCU4_CITSI|nr:protein RAE1 [Citrus sinensis]
MATFGAAAVATNQNPNNSIEVSQPPNDSVSSLCFSPKANILVATSWDNQVRCWEISHSGTAVASVPKASISHDHPDVTSRSRCGLCSLVVGQPVTVAMHDAPIKEVTWIPEMNLLATGSWDKTLKQPNPVHTQQLPDRCHAFTVRYQLMVVGTADRNLVVFNLQNPQLKHVFCVAAAAATLVVG